MVQYIKQGDIFGRIGSGIGQGLAQQLPEEINRSRLSAGLKNLSEQKNLTPFEQFSALSSIPGITPQMIQSGSELLRQQGIAQGFRNVPATSSPEQNKSSININVNPQLQESQTKGLVTKTPTQAALNPYIPKTLPQIQSRAAELMQKNPNLYPTAQDAMNGAVLEDKQNQSVNAALQGQRSSQLGVQENVRNQLRNLQSAANAQIPDNVYQDIENEVLSDINSGKKDEATAEKDGLKKLDAISREYQNLANLGNWTFPFQNAKGAAQTIHSLRNDFKKRNDLENFADSLTGKNGISPSKAYYEAFPVEEKPSLDKFVKSLPLIKSKTEKVIGAGPGLAGLGYSGRKNQTSETEKILPTLAKLMGKDASPLSIAEELRLKGYDPNVWLDYLTKNKRSLDLTERQVRELGKPRSWFPSLNDLWFFIGSGKDKLIED